MNMSFYEYREYLYHEKSHPKPDEEVWVDKRDSFLSLYLSLIPFIAFEYLIERETSFPSGLIFPAGYLLFWAYYYTYYKPNYLEECLSKPRGINFTSMLALIFGVAIWFTKTTFIKLIDFFFRLFFHQVNKTTNCKVKRNKSRTTSKTRLPYDILEALNTLGLPENVNWQQIHARYRELAKQYHPDLHPEITKAGKRFMIYDAAYKKLLAYRLRRKF